MHFMWTCMDYFFSLAVLLSVPILFPSVSRCINIAFVSANYPYVTYVQVDYFVVVVLFDSLLCMPLYPLPVF